MAVLCKILSLPLFLASISLNFKWIFNACFRCSTLMCRISSNVVQHRNLLGLIPVTWFASETSPINRASNLPGKFGKFLHRFWKKATRSRILQWVHFNCKWFDAWKNFFAAAAAAAKWELVYDLMIPFSRATHFCSGGSRSFKSNLTVRYTNSTKHD